MYSSAQVHLPVPVVSDHGLLRQVPPEPGGGGNLQRPDRAVGQQSEQAHGPA